MKSTKILRWITLASFGASLTALAACGGISDVGSGDQPGEAGANGTATGGSKGEGANGTGASASMGASSNVAGKEPGPGTGGSVAVELCATDEDCTSPGGPCEPCADGSYACNRAYCAPGGKCVTERDQCNTECTTDEECPVPGIACADCGDGSTSCPTSQCLKGRCQTSNPGCARVDPCKGQACGSECKLCGPDGVCDTLKPSYCSAEGKCQPGSPQCAPTEPQCKVSEDCPPIDGVCKLCPNFKCAVQACLRSSCQLVCEL